LRSISAPWPPGYTVGGRKGDSPRGRFVYFRNWGQPGTVIEMAHATPTRMRIFDAVRTAAVGWDGSDPIRANGRAEPMSAPADVVRRLPLMQADAIGQICVLAPRCGARHVD